MIIDGRSLPADRGKVRPEEPPALVGVRETEPLRGLLPSPNLTKVSMDFSKFPLRPFKTVAFLFSSKNPMSLNLNILFSCSSLPEEATWVPKTRDGLLRTRGDEGLYSSGSSFM